jgi:hypothetical protein
MAKIDPKILAAIQAEPEIEPEADKLETLKKYVREARDLDKERTDLSERLDEVSQKLKTLYFETLPMLLDGAGVPSITVEGEGNMPRVTAQAKPYYNANIAASWPDDKRRAAFAYLKKIGHDDLIKTEVNVSFGRGESEKAEQVSEALRKKGLTPVMKEGVHAQTLTAWMKNQIEKHNTTPDLEKIGGHVGRIVSLKYED